MMKMKFLNNGQCRLIKDIFPYLNPQSIHVKEYNEAFFPFHIRENFLLSGESFSPFYSIFFGMKNEHLKAD